MLIDCRRRERQTPFALAVARLSRRRAEEYQTARLASIARLGYDYWTPFGRVNLVFYPVDAQDEAACRRLVLAVFGGTRAEMEWDT